MSYPLAGKRVVLKPNLVEYHRDKVINTHPHVVAAVIELCRQEGAAEVIVAEGPGHWRNVEYLVTASGLGDVLRQEITHAHLLLLKRAGHVGMFDQPEEFNAAVLAFLRGEEVGREVWPE